MSENITPAYREEKLLANIAGGDYEITPATRKEKLLAEIAEIQGYLSEIQGLPDTTGASAGDVLTIGSDGPEWGAVPKELPDTTGASQGDVLTVGSSGLEWAAPSGGGGFLITSELVDNTPTLNKTANEIIAVLASGVSPVCYFLGSYDGFVGMTDYNGYIFTFGVNQYEAATGDDYPTFISQ